MPRLLDSYITRQLLLPFAVGLLTFVVLISGHFLWQATQIIVQHRVNVWSILAFVGMQIPRAALLAIPVSALLASSLTLNRMASDGELTALRAGGVSTLRITAPLACMALLACLLVLADSEALAPAAQRRASRLVTSIILSRKALSFKPRTFTDAGDGVHVYVRETDTRRDLLERVMVLIVPASGPVMATFTPRATFSAEGIKLDPGQWCILDDQGSFTSGRDGGTRVNLRSIGGGGMLGGDAMGDLSLGELHRRAHDLSGRYPGQGGRYLTELNSRLALSLSPLVFTLLAIPLTLVLGRRESLIGVLATIILAFVYFVLMLWMRMLGGAGKLPPVAAAWLPDAAILALAAFGIWRTR